MITYKMKNFLLLTLFLLAAPMLRAQDDDILKAMDYYKGASSLTAAVTRTKHNAALTNDAAAQGTLYFKSPNRLSIVFEDENDKLIMADGVFTMVTNGEKQTAKGATLAQFQTLLAAFSEQFLGNSSAGASNAEVAITSDGNLRTVTITPAAESSNKTKRRLLFTSFSLTIDVKNQRIKSLRMNERGTNYTQYDFSGFSLNAPIPDSAFIP